MLNPVGSFSKHNISYMNFVYIQLPLINTAIKSEISGIFRNYRKLSAAGVTLLVSEFVNVNHLSGIKKI
jgi:hypothetical protein